MSCECNFEPKVPIACAQDLIALVKAGDYGKGQVLQHAGCILGQSGALIAKLRGDDDSAPIFSGMVPETPDTIEGCIEKLEIEMDAVDADSDAMQANPVLTALLMKLVELAIKKLLEQFS